MIVGSPFPRRLVWWLAAVLAVSGCTAVRPLDTLTLRDRQGRQFVWANGYAPRSASEGATAFGKLTIDVRLAPEFTFLLPDGVRVSSRSIDFALLEPAARSVVRKAGLPTDVFWHAKSPAQGWAGRGYSFHVELDAQGKGTFLHLATCGEPRRAILGSADGRELFDLPIDQADLEKLFDAKGHVQRVHIAIGLDCL